jgi:4-hydroxy-2-oxovalerate aldolase
MTDNKKSPKKLQILECTLRDGSYTINFGFTATDTAVIAKALEHVGFRLIEIGHGIGLHASEAGKGKAAETDEAYCKAAAEVLKEAKWGMFCIPGIARLEDVDMAASYGMGFLRVGTNANEAEQAEPFIARAKKHGMYVSANFMKSYALEPKEFAQKAILAQKLGADVLSVVDSAGGMLVSELEAYFRAVRDVCDIDLAFHGHNNLGLAVSHSLKAVELGAVIVDTTLQGMGRSSGNAPSEMMVAALKRTGIDLGIDPIEVADISEKYVRPLLRRPGHSSLDVIGGYAQFHSSYMGLIRKYSSQYRVDPRRLIVALCERDKLNADAKLVEEIAKHLLSKSTELFPASLGFNDYFGDEQN